MKLRNKQTPNRLGEIVQSADGQGSGIAIKTDQGIVWYYHSLAELNEEWEDYEEPKEYEETKEYWTIDWTCTGVTRNKYRGDDIDDFNEVIGNYFETREEAEKAEEKLKAWKRLGDKGFRFDGWTIDDGLKISICTNFEGDNIYSESEKEIRTNLDLLFGGEE